MAHKTLIGGTAYEIKGGKTLVGGVAYAIKGGKTLVGGTAYGITFGNPTFEFVVKFAGSSYTYRAEEGMTWADFVNSGYNDGKFTVFASQYVGFNNMMLCNMKTYAFIKSNEVISATISYEAT